MRLSLPDAAATLRERLPAQLRQRGIALVLTLAIEALLVLAILTLGIAPDPPKPKDGPRLTTFAVEGAKPESKQAPDQAKDAPGVCRGRIQPQQASPSAQTTMPLPAQPAPQPPPLIPIPSNQAAGFSIANLPQQPAAPGPKKAMMGPAFTPLAGDSKRIGTAPGGQPLYAAAWYREPDDSELAGYLSTADGPGYALIACRTVADWRVEDCVALDEYPSGSNIARSVLAAAWHFRVPPAALGRSLQGRRMGADPDYGDPPQRLGCFVGGIHPVGRVQHAHRQFGLVLVDQHADLDLAGGDRLDVDAAVAQRAEHGAGHAGMAFHADADDADLGDLAVGDDAVEADRFALLLQQRLRARQIGLRAR